MYVLARPRFEDVAIPIEQWKAAWDEAGIGAPPTEPAETPISAAAVEAQFLGALLHVGATVPEQGDIEVPRSAADVLARLERVYHALYPTTKESRRREHFHYEEVEWLGEF